MRLLTHMNYTQDLQATCRLVHVHVIPLVHMYIHVGCRFAIKNSTKIGMVYTTECQMRHGGKENSKEIQQHYHAQCI